MYTHFSSNNNIYYAASNIASVYDGQWTLSLTSNNTISNPSNCTIDATNGGVFLGNGKIGLVTSTLNTSISEAMITTNLTYSDGKSKANVVEPFYIDNVKFFDNVNTTTYTVTQQSLNMFNAVFTTSYTASNSTLGVVSVSADLYTPQQYPFCIVQTLNVTPSQNMTECDIYHEMYAKKNMYNVEYNNNVIYNETINPTKGLYILSGKGYVNNTGNGNPVDQITVAGASMYLFENPLEWQNLGFNVYRDNTSKAYSFIKLTNLTANTTYKFHIISSIISSADFNSPIEECKRILLKVANIDTTSTAIMTKIRGDHSLAWSNLWNTDINIVPKTGITSQETDTLMGIKRQLRYSMYNVFSSVRDNINVEVNPLNLSVIDHDGFVLYSGDLWLIPVLLLIRPDVARALIEYRYKALNIAEQLAAGYGFKGVKFPYENDTIGYKNALYWDTVGPLAIFNNGLISINTWNYFRITRDRDWLSKKGFPILKNVADFYASAASQDPTTGIWHIQNTINLNGTISAQDNAFTVNCALLAIKYALEASYELEYYVKQSWLDVYYGLQIPVDQNNDILFDTSLDFTNIGNTTLNIIEPWFLLLPYYSQMYYNSTCNCATSGSTNSRTVANSVLQNLDAYSPLINPNYTMHPFNVGLEAMMRAIYSQYDTSFAEGFQTVLLNFIQNVSGQTGSAQVAWGNMTNNNTNNTNCCQKINDITLNSILLFILLQGGLQLNIQGGVAQSRFYYEEMQTVNAISANLPKTWKSINLVLNSKPIVTVNQLFYP